MNEPQMRRINRSIYRAPVLTLVELEDEGQDFTRFYVKRDGGILAATPFQSWLWAGHRVVNKIRRGSRPLLEKNGVELKLKYRVTAVSHLRYGICRYCKCSNRYACSGGCSWADVTRTRCNAPGCLKKHQQETA